MVTLLKTIIYLCTLLGVEATACEDGWTHFQTSCYLFKDDLENWASAGVSILLIEISSTIFLQQILFIYSVKIPTSITNKNLGSWLQTRSQLHKMQIQLKLKLQYWKSGTIWYYSIFINICLTSTFRCVCFLLCNDSCIITYM